MLKDIPHPPPPGDFLVFSWWFLKIKSKFFLAFENFKNIPHPTPPQDFLVVSWWILLIKSFEIHNMKHHGLVVNFQHFISVPWPQENLMVNKLFFYRPHHKKISWSLGEIIPNPTPPKAFLMVSWWIFLLKSLWFENVKKIFHTLIHQEIFLWSHGEFF